MPHYIRILPLLFLAACSTARFSYKADIELANGRDAELRYDRSYSVTDDMVLCIITGVLYGGWCWKYVFMPTHSQRVEITDHAHAYVRRKTGQKFRVKSRRHARLDYSNTPVRKEINFLDGKP